MNLMAALESGLRASVDSTAAWFALLALGLNVHYGFTGLLNFGQVGFMLMGAYGVGISVSIFGLPLWVGVIVAILAAILLALILGAPTLRLRADYFAITTIAAAEVLRLLANSRVSTPLTRGPFGIQYNASAFYGLNPLPTPGALTWGPFSFTRNQTWTLLVGWTLAIGLSVVVYALMRSPWGRILRSIREDEDAARALGKNVFSYKMQSLMLGGVIGALGGVVYTLGGATVNPQTFRPEFTFYAYAMLIVGGVASRFGPVIGAFIFWFVLQSASALVRQASAADLLPDWISGAAAVGGVPFVLTGAVLMILVVYRPQGMFGNRREMALDV